MGRLLDRYVQGQCVDVWTQIVGTGEGIRNTSEFMDEAELVGRETLRRARRNVERLFEGLPALGYVFDSRPGIVTFAPPEPDVAEQIDALEARMGMMPLAFRWWLEEVGRVNFMGSHPDWEFDYPDPLVVTAPPSDISNEFDFWEADLNTEWERPQFTIGFSPDDLHKASISGGPPYSLLVPNQGADGLVFWERHQTTFINHIRIAFSQGGFLGLSMSLNDHPALEDLAQLASTLEPI